MQTIGQIRNSATELYRLIFLLTGQSDLSLDITQDIISSQDAAEPFDASRAVTEAYVFMHGALVSSAKRTASRRFKGVEIPPRTWSLDPETTKARLESALLDIDIFARWALVLTVFEGLSIEEASALLATDTELVRQGQIIGLLELTRNLTRLQSLSCNLCPDQMKAEVQHA
jgi:DNA-directed RNA polymerase specialized sigma24 family protein